MALTKTEQAIRAREKRSREQGRAKRREQREGAAEAKREAADMKKAAKDAGCSTASMAMEMVTSSPSTAPPPSAARFQLTP